MSDLDGFIESTNDDIKNLEADNYEDQLGGEVSKKKNEFLEVEFFCLYSFFGIKKIVLL